MEFILSQSRFVFHIGKLCEILNIFPHCPLSGGGICRSRYGGRRHGWRGDCRRAISNPRGYAPICCLRIGTAMRKAPRVTIAVVQASAEDAAKQRTLTATEAIIDLVFKRDSPY